MGEDQDVEPLGEEEKVSRSEMVVGEVPEHSGLPTQIGIGVVEVSYAAALTSAVELGATETRRLSRIPPLGQAP